MFTPGGCVRTAGGRGRWMRRLRSAACTAVRPTPLRPARRRARRYCSRTRQVRLLRISSTWMRVEADVFAQVGLPPRQAAELVERLVGAAAHVLEAIDGVAHGLAGNDHHPLAPRMGVVWQPLGAAAGQCRHLRQHLEAVVERLAVRPCGRAVRPLPRQQRIRPLDIGPADEEPAARRELAHDRGEAPRDAVERQPPQEQAGDGEVEGMGNLRKIEIVVQDEVSALGPYPGSRQFDLDAGDEQLDVPVEAPVMALFHVGQQVHRGREAAAADLEDVVRRQQSLAAEEVEDPGAVFGPPAGGRRRRVERCLSLMARRAERLVRRLRVEAAVFGKPAIDVAVVAELAGVEHADAPADRLNGRPGVRDEQDRPPRGEKALQRRHALPLELFVADGENFVEQEDVGIEIGGNREAEPHVHAGGVVLDRHVHEVLKPRVRHHAVVHRRAPRRATGRGWRR